jgi:hypothetical protein
MHQVTAALLACLAFGCGGGQKAKPPAAVKTTVVVTCGTKNIVFDGGLAWRMTMECGTKQTYTLESNGEVLGGKWVVEWPRECEDHRPTMNVDLRASWMACEQVTGWSKEIVVGEEVRIPLMCNPDEVPPESACR